MRYKITRKIIYSIDVDASSPEAAIDKEEQIRLAVEELGEQYRGPRHSGHEESVTVERTASS